ncbi:MAG: MATE family efflux transporter [Clostridiales bacterium]|nr:MATE family efflux transporter [Clostridiales bacterium]
MSENPSLHFSHDKQIDIEVEGVSQKRRLIIDLTWPALAESILVTLISMADMIMVSSLGTYALSAVGLVSQPKFIMMAAFMAMNTGTTALVARFKGAHSVNDANSALQQAMNISLCLTIVVCAAMTFFAEPLVRLLAGSEISEQTILEGLGYLRIQIYGFPTMSFTFSMNAALRGAGNTRASFYNNTVANIVNVIMNYCLIFGRFGFPRLAVAGASLATVIGQFVGMCMAVAVLVGGKQYISFNFKDRWRFDLSMIKRIVNIGIPALIEQVIMRVGTLWFTTIVTALGDTAYAAHMIAMNSQQISWTTGMAFGTAATTLVGQSLGRNRDDLAREYVKLTQNMGYYISTSIALALFFFGRAFSGLYSKDLLIIGLAADMLRIIALSNPLMNARFVYVSALRGAGDARFMAGVTFIGVLLLRPVIALTLTRVFSMGLYGIWIALIIESLICFFIVLFRYRSGKWALIKI